MQWRIEDWSHGNARRRTLPELFRRGVSLVSSRATNWRAPFLRSTMREPSATMSAPLISGNIILLCTSSDRQHTTKDKHRLRMSLLCGTGNPVERLFVRLPQSDASRI